MNVPSETALVESPHETPFDVLLHGIIGVDYVLHLDAALNQAHSSTRFAIEREERTTGGLMWRVAQLLQSAQQRVALLGNPIGDDSNGLLILRENQNVPLLYAPVKTPSTSTAFETPYRVVLPTHGERPIFLERYQAAQKDDFQQRFAAVSYPRAIKICASDELPFAALHLARWARAEQIPFYFVCTNQTPFNEDARLAVEQLRAMATAVFAFEKTNHEMAELWHDGRALEIARELLV